MAFPSSARAGDDPDFLMPFRKGDFAQADVHGPRTAEAGFLYRIDPLPSGRAVVLVQSSKQPDWDYAFHNADYLLAAPPEVRQLDPHWAAGDVLRFRLQANATRKVDTKTDAEGKRRNGTRVPVGRERLPEWLGRKAEQSGFAFAEGDVRVATGYVYFAKDNREDGRLFSVRYDGVLRVTDADLFRVALESGIGPAKGFGFGLLSVAPLRE
jgi:CRISPR system Cascade subunit CasE